MTENELSKEIVDAALKVHRALGPGLFESVYHKVMECELKRRGLIVKYKERMAIRYEELQINNAFEADLIVNDIVRVVNNLPDKT